jgi:peptide/nickel transport system substrate-binding protein/oligopeptide transport system substrate-binding protein
MEGLRRAAALGLLMALLPACSQRHSVAAPSPKRGGILRLGLVRPNSLDPALAQSQEELLLARQMFATLTVPDPLTLAARPGLAATWQASADQTQWDFTLRPGAEFANGRPITATDVKASLSRVAAKPTASPSADLLSAVHGFGDFNSGQATDLAGITAPSPTVLHISLDQPFSVLPELLSSPVFGIVPADAGAATFAQQPTGSGPFGLVTRSGDHLSLRPSPGWGHYLDGIDASFFDDVAGSYRAFQAGQLDWSRVPPEAMGAAGKQYGRGQFSPYLAELFYGFNLKSPAFVDARFREAIIHAIDRRALVAAVYKNTVEPLDGILVRGLPSHQADPCGPKCSFDAGQARTLIAQAFPPPATPPQITINYDNDPTQDAVAKAIQSDLSAVGIPVLLDAKAVAEYPKFAVSGQQQFFRLGWVAAYPSADAFLAPLFATGSTSNLTGLSSPEVDQALAAARKEADPGQRDIDYQAAERAVMAQLPVVPIAQFDLTAVAAATVRGLTPSVTGTFDAAGVWLTTARSR